MLYLNGKEVDTFSYPCGERQVRLGDDTPERDEECIIKLIFQGSDDIIDLMMLRDVLKYHSKVILEMPYVPFGREDRQVMGRAFSLKVFSDLINSMDFDLVIVVDPHSKATVDLLNNCQVRDPDYLGVEQFAHIYANPVIVAPDEGARERAEREAYHNNIPLVQVKKKRNPQDGSLEIVGVEGEFAGKDLLVLDDICDGGGTFLMLADHLGDAPASKHLYVTHGFFTKGKEVLEEKYDTVIAEYDYAAILKTTVEEYDYADIFK